MKRVPPCFLAFLEATRSLRPSADGEARVWCDALLASADLRNAAQVDDVAGARTAIAAIARRTWPDSASIPRGVRTQLGVLGVDVRW